MNRRTVFFIAALVALVVAIAAVLGSASPASSSSSGRKPPHWFKPASAARPGPPHYFRKLDSCPTGVDHGYRTARAAARAARAATAAGVYCVAAKDAHYRQLKREGYSPPPPSTGYHYTGFGPTSSSPIATRMGVGYTFEVVDFNVDQGSIYSHSIMTTHMVRADSGGTQWIEAGYGESTGQMDHACIFSFRGGTDSGAWPTFCDSLPITVGNFYSFRVYHVGVGNSAPNEQSFVLYNGVWTQLLVSTAFRCLATSGNGACYFDSVFEHYSDDAAAPHKNWVASSDDTNGNGIRAKLGELRQLGGNWASWTANTDTEEINNVYDICNWTESTTFRVSRTSAEEPVPCPDPPPGE